VYFRIEKSCKKYCYNLKCLVRLGQSWESQNSTHFIHLNIDSENNLLFLNIHTICILLHCRRSAYLESRVTYFFFNFGSQRKLLCLYRNNMQALYSLGNNYFRVENPLKNYNYHGVALAAGDDDNNNKSLYFGSIATLKMTIQQQQHNNACAV